MTGRMHNGVGVAPADLGGELVSLLEGLIAAHEELLRNAGAQRAAIGRADGEALRACVEAQAGIVARIEELEERRRRLVGARPGAGPGPTISETASRLPEPARGRVLAAAARLRELLVRVQGEVRTIRSATHAMLGHMEGLMRQVGRRLSHAGMYGRAGAVEPGAVVVSGLDLRH